MNERSAPLADEAARLWSAVQQWTRESFPAPGPDGQLGPDCQWCPICQFLSVLRGERPDVTERVAEAGTALLSALRGMSDSAAPTHPAGPAPPRVQHIDLVDPE